MARKLPAVTGLARTDISTVVRMAATPLFGSRTKRKMLPYFTKNLLSLPATTNAVSYVISANGLYDPDISGVGTQPRGFDQMMVFYEHYTVYQARCVVTFQNFDPSSPTVFIAARGDVVNVPSYVDVMENGNSVSTRLNPSTQFGCIKELTLIINVASFLGFDDLADSNVARGDLSSNPAEGVFFHIGAFDANATTTSSVTFQVRVTYEAVFSEARIITPSLGASLRAAISHEAMQRSLADSCSRQLRRTTLS